MIVTDDWKLIPPEPQVLIIDNFYDDLSWLIPYLRQQLPVVHEKANYAGQMFLPPKEKLDFAMKKLSDVLSEDLSHMNNLGKGEIRLTLRQNQNHYKTLIHADDSLNAVVYLSGNESDSGGTVFYKHKELGLTFYDLNHPLQRKLDILFSVDTNDSSQWEIIKSVPFKKNRAIIFNGRYYHSVPQQFYGQSLEDGRVTQSFFFHELRNRFF